LRAVESLPGPEATALLGIDEQIDDLDEEELVVSLPNGQR
jgi:hypothetical protein